jgi:hypothetical protein
VLLPSRLRQALESLLPAKYYLGCRARWRWCVRIQREGFFTAFRRWHLWSKILNTPPVYTDPIERGCDLAVHMMCYRLDYLSAIWALKSFYYQSQKTYPLVIHIQGESTPILEDRLRTHFPNARFIFQTEADQVVESFLSERNCHKLLSFRKAIPTVQKLTDFLIMAKSRRILIVDADVLFFQCPDELLQSDGSDEVFLAQRDFMSAYTIPPSRGMAEFDIDLQPEINVGIMRLAPDMIDLARCEQYLAHPEFAQLEGHTEQTLWALEASRRRAVAYLPPSYDISENGHPNYSTLKARHFAGLSRPLLTREGIPCLIKRGFLEALNRSSPPFKTELVPEDRVAGHSMDSPAEPP